MQKSDSFNHSCTIFVSTVQCLPRLVHLHLVNSANNGKPSEKISPVHLKQQIHMGTQTIMLCYCKLTHPIVRAFVNANKLLSNQSIVNGNSKITTIILLLSYRFNACMKLNAIVFNSFSFLRASFRNCLL